MLFCLGEPPVRFLFLCCFSFLMFIFICQCSSFWCCIFVVLLYLHLIFRLLYYVTGTSPVKTSPPALHPTPTTFDCLFFFIYHKHYSFDGAFFTGRRFFTLCSLPTFLAQPAFIKASLGARSYSLKFAGLHIDP